MGKAEDLAAKAMEGGSSAGIYGAIISSGFELLRQSGLIPNQELEAMEKEGKANRKLERLALLLGMLEQSAKVQSGNAAAKVQANLNAPEIADSIYRSNITPRETEIANQASGRYMAQNPQAMGTMQGTDVNQVVIKNAADYAKRKQEATQRAGQVTPQSIYAPATDPLQLLKEQNPEHYLDMAARPKQTNERGDGLDDVEVQILNQKMAEGYSPQDLSKMLATFKRPEVQKGVTTNG